MRRSHVAFGARGLLALTAVCTSLSLLAWLFVFTQQDIKRMIHSGAAFQDAVCGTPPWQACRSLVGKFESACIDGPRIPSIVLALAALVAALWVYLYRMLRAAWLRLCEQDAQASLRDSLKQVQEQARVFNYAPPVPEDDGLHQRTTLVRDQPLPMF